MISNDPEKYLISLVGKEKIKKENLGLLRIKKLLEYLGNPEKKLKYIHIGGTSGKGSAATFLSCIITEAKYKTGLFLSPHLEKINERIQINNKPIRDKDFIKELKSTEKIIKKHPEIKPTYFETVAALAISYFKKKKVDLAVMEVGMGGELDATNIIKPLICIITNVDLEHTDILGKTVEKIALTKSKIIKENCLVITGVKQKSVLEIIKKQCKKVRARFITFRKQKFELGLPGQFQQENANLAVTAAKQLTKLGFKISQNSIKKGLKSAFIPGRIEIVRRSPLVILDGAHNPAKIKALVESLKLFKYQNLILVIAIKKKKDIFKMLKQVVPLSKTIIFTKFKDDSSFRPKKLLKVFVKLKFNKKNYIYNDSKQAIKKAFQLANKNDLILITGSLYLVGEVRRFILKRPTQR